MLSRKVACSCAPRCPHLYSSFLSFLERFAYPEIGGRGVELFIRPFFHIPRVFGFFCIYFFFVLPHFGAWHSSHSSQSSPPLIRWPQWALASGSSSNPAQPPTAVQRPSAVKFKLEYRCEHPCHPTAHLTTTCWDFWSEPALSCLSFNLLPINIKQYGKNSIHQKESRLFCHPAY